MPPTPRDVVRRQELARFLRTRRAELQPEDVGLPRRERRRVPGLRRHEVANLAGVSDTWYTWLEQARDIRVSVEALDSLSRALRLDDDAWRYVRRLAGAPVVEAMPPPESLDPQLTGLLDDLHPHPAIITTGTFDLVAWNAAYVRLFGDPDELPAKQQNAMSLFFTNPRLRERMRDWEIEAREVAARFRAESGKDTGNPRFQEVVSDLSELSAEFRTIWQLGEVRRFVATIQTFIDPDVGEIQVRLLRLRPLDQPGLTVTVHRAYNEESHERLRRLLG